MCLKEVNPVQKDLLIMNLMKENEDLKRQVKSSSDLELSNLKVQNFQVIQENKKLIMQLQTAFGNSTDFKDLMELVNQLKRDNFIFFSDNAKLTQTNAKLEEELYYYKKTHGLQINPNLLKTEHYNVDRLKVRVEVLEKITKNMKEENSRKDREIDNLQKKIKDLNLVGKNKLLKDLNNSKSELTHCMQTIDQLTNIREIMEKDNKQLVDMNKQLLNQLKKGN